LILCFVTASCKHTVESEHKRKKSQGRIKASGVTKNKRAVQYENNKSVIGPSSSGMGRRCPW
jgi:hypothetical protein